MASRILPWNSEPVLRPYRRCLQFAFFNTVTWQVGLSTPLILFAQQLGATPTQLGFLASLVLLLTPLQILSTALLPRLGYKRLMLGGWGLRSLLLIVPVGIAVRAHLSGSNPWMAPLLAAAIFLFCVFRAIGLAGILPWFYAIVPEPVRGRYFAAESSMLGAASVIILTLSAASFALMPIFAAVALQFGCALVASLLSWLALREVPDGPPPPPASLGALLRATPPLLFQPSDYRRYLVVSLLVGALTATAPAFIPYYLKTTGQLSTGGVMALEIVRYLSMVVAAQLVRRKIDLLGARPYLLATQALYFFFAAYWLCRLHGWGGGTAGLVCSYVVLGLAGTGWSVGNAHYLPKVATAEQHTLRLALHGATTALASGLALIAWGRLLQPADGGLGLISPGWFTAMFACLLAGSALVSSLIAARPEPHADAAEPLHVINTVLRPWRAALYLINLAEPVPRVPSAPPESPHDNQGRSSG